MLTTLQKLGGWSEGTNVRGWIHSTTWDSQHSELMNIAQRTRRKEVREAKKYITLVIKKLIYFNF